MSAERFEIIESKLAHQEQLLGDLNDVMTAQQARIMHLEELCKSLIDRVRSLAEAQPAGDPLAERPPHY